jgi:hypothetical protein
MKRLTILILALASVAAAAGAAEAQAHRSNPKPIVVTFEKHVVDPVNFVFQGTTGGKVKGTLESRLVSLSGDGAIKTVTFDWIVTANAKHKSFVARTTGTWDTTTGSVVMDGEVTQGWHRGAPVHEQGQLVDPATLTFAGEIQIFARDCDD